LATDLSSSLLALGSRVVLSSEASSSSLSADSDSVEDVEDSVLDAADSLSFSEVVVVVAAEVRSAAAAAQLILRLDEVRRDIVVVLRQRQWAALSAPEVEDIIHHRVSAQLPTVRGLTRSIEIGGLPSRLPAALAKTARAVREEVGA